LAAATPKDRMLFAGLVADTPGRKITIEGQPP